MPDQVRRSGERESDGRPGCWVVQLQHHAGNQGVDLVTADGERRLVRGDTTIVLAVRSTDRSLADRIRPHAPEVHAIGDSNEPGLLVDAVEAGARLGAAL